MKMKERRGLYQCLPPDSREFEDLVKILSSFYLDSSSRGTFSYCKAKLIHNELLEKEFIEKRREMKQEGRTELEMAESYCFLYPDKSKLQWICEKGLSVGHSRITTLGNPSVGIYLSKYADLLQINPFEASSSGDVIIFKVMRGRLKHVHENMPKNAMEPTPKFDCHVSKNANKVTTLLSYRAFELTQQYFFEFAFDEIKVRPRHICPYAVVSFQFNTIPPEVRRGKNYLVWSGLLANKDQELFPACIRSSGRPYLPFNLPEKLEVSQGMQLDQVKRKIPSVLFCWDMYNMSREVFKYGMSCSLFDVVEGKGKAVSGSLAGLVHKLERDRMKLEVSQGMQLDQVKRKIPSVLFCWDMYNMSREVFKYGMSCSLFDVVEGKGKAVSGSLAGLVHKLERDRMVLVKPLPDRGFLFLFADGQQ
ncbi:LOW QUALITY PROTEIN: hypothetical protein CRUP_003821 [Coryphaenoides rupestris]|nr:LOW QUALITY PROTEIN: hypothetical protein CRUP_003821 [Coryphaenoides rupestris]